MSDRFPASLRDLTARIAAAALVCAVLGWSPAALGADDRDVFRLREVGEPVPSLSLRDPAGGEHSLEPERGPVLLFFWSVYCPNCKEAMPGLAELHRKWGPRGLRIWAINVDGERFSNAVHAYVQDAEPPFPVLFDRLEGEYLVAADPLGVSKTPTLYLGDGRGRIVLRQVIEIDYAGLEAAVARLGL